ncbi:Arylsulfatase [Gimesia chilikensis]|uniref:Arylsulfatase n=1 Tax=Gimesia chilikensis TaxID=2605989 RepID=A0A517WE58_9PLAN|nr:sulfatase-like hydrolase/transferase [Gimesia chilikensis]QDU03538.1 Arylsulfatase [Gimesia chilikensis]
MRLSGITCLILVQLFVSAVSAETPRPDMVIFLSDDHTWRDSSVYGSPDIKTPNMNRLAAQGMTFNNAFVASPSCAPSRAALLTGLYPANNGAEPNHSRPRVEIKKLPAYLQELGYEVVSFGKVGHYKQTPEYGFDIARHYRYHEDIAIPKAIEWLKQRDSDRPLCLFVGTNWPHVPWPEEIGDIDPARLQVPPHHVDTPVTREWRAKYMAAIQTMDRELGQVYDVARKKLGENVFFLHTSDHGAQWPFGKWNLYDEGIRTPLIVSWPGKIKPGVRTDAMASWIDILPTLIDVAGGTPLDSIDGRSLLPVLKGETTKHREVIFTTHSGDGDNNVYPMRAARTLDGWKYIRNLHPEFRFTSHVTNARAKNGYWDSWVQKAITHPQARQKVRRYLERPDEELYQVNTDPYEQQNRVNEPEQAERLRMLRQQVDDWLAETGDQKNVYGRPQRIAAQEKPNVIMVFIDDMGWSDLSCFKGAAVKTNNIDRLADEGIRFTNFYVNSPICSPSRVALTTGQYPQRWRINSYLAQRKKNRERGLAQWLDPKAPVLARELKHAGYATGHFGKWHMGGQRDVGEAPLITRYGFDRSLTNFEGLGPRVLPLKDAYDGKPPQKHDLGSANLGHGPIRWEDRSVVTAAFVKDALNFIDQAEATGQPFYLNLWPDDVHSPFFPPEVMRDATDGSKRALYYAVLKAMDQQLGALFDRIRNDEQLKNNTLILIASDNGPETGAGLANPLRGAKTWLYEGGVRSPLIVWGPSLINPKAAGTTNNTSVLSALDLNRSLYSLTGTELPQGVQLDGEDLADTLLGKEKQSRQAPLFWRRPPDRPGTREEPNPDLAARAGKWKFYMNYDQTGIQLYDLEQDVSETRNQATQHPDLVKRLQQAVNEWNSGLPADAGDPNWRPKKKPAKTGKAKAAN